MKDDFQRWRGLIQAICFRRGVDYNDVEDVVQVVLLDFWQRRAAGMVRDERGFIIRTTALACGDIPIHTPEQGSRGERSKIVSFRTTRYLLHLDRSGNWRSMSVEDLPGEWEDRQVDYETPETLFFSRYISPDLSTAMDSLTLKKRQSIECRAGGLGYREVAALLGRNVAAEKRSLAIARQQLRTMLR